MISIEQNIKNTNQSILQLTIQKKQIQKEIFRLEGTLKVFTDLKKLGVDEITLNKNEVIDHEDIST